MFPNPVGQRDRAILAVLYWTACRAGACAKLSLGDFFSDGKRYWFNLGEKGGRPHTVMASHSVQVFLLSYIEAAGIGEEAREWATLSLGNWADTRALFLPAHLNRVVVDCPRGNLTGNDILRIVKRRVRDVGLPEGSFSAHSFRATSATELCRRGVPREKVQFLLGHSSSRTTELYDHSHEERAMEIVDQITL